MDSCREATRHAACCLGQVTFAANNHKTECVGEDGNLRTIVLRDSQEAPKRKRTLGDEAARSLHTPSDVVSRPVDQQVKKAVRPREVQRQDPPSKKRITEARYKAERAEAAQVALERNLEHKASFSRGLPLWKLLRG